MMLISSILASAAGLGIRGWGFGLKKVTKLEICLLSRTTQNAFIPDIFAPG
jgi:hypothetical protein